MIKNFFDAITHHGGIHVYNPSYSVVRGKHIRVTNQNYENGEKVKSLLNIDGEELSFKEFV